MIDAGLLQELKEYFDYMSIHEFTRQTGLAKAIGVPELREYFAGRKRLCDCINEMKANTQALAEVQTAKIQHIVDAWGWPICTLDATKTIHTHLIGSNHTSMAKAWEHDVCGPAFRNVNEFLGRRCICYV
jgi:adenylate isopentenyltransferase (cytokinin synthase)